MTPLAENDDVVFMGELARRPSSIDMSVSTLHVKGSVISKPSSELAPGNATVESSTFKRISSNRRSVK